MARKGELDGVYAVRDIIEEYEDVLIVGRKPTVVATFNVRAEVTVIDNENIGGGFIYRMTDKKGQIAIVSHLQLEKFISDKVLVKLR